LDLEVLVVTPEETRKGVDKTGEQNILHCVHKKVSLNVFLA